ARGGVLEGQRADGHAVQGADAACAACHRRSGLGAAEGNYVAPPISGEYLRQPRITNGTHPDRAASSSAPQRRPAYTLDSFARALREGVGSDGVPLSALMPRYALADDEVARLFEHLHAIGTAAVPGVDEQSLQFATVVTPEAQPQARDAMLATLRQFFAERNRIIAGTARPITHTELGVKYRVTRSWTLHEWVLEGGPESWPAQLERLFAAQPVFAVVSGIGGAHWDPVHRFCEQRHLPCLFPNVDVPVVQEQGFYNLYFSRGVLLEADLFAAALRQSGAPPEGARLVQVVRHDSAGAAGAARLSALLAAAGWEVETRELASGDRARAVQQALRVPPDARLVLWLPAADLAVLPPPPAGVQAWLAGSQAGIDVPPLPDAWKGISEISYAYELPERRSVAMRLPEGWFHINGIALTEPRVQYQTFLACQILSEGIGELHISFQPDYLIERLEVMLSHRRLNALYPRLSLGIGQRFASKGGYLVRIGPAAALQADGDWRVP
ncbi:MAG: c-type cytochrome, partial [Pseudomonadota bacterium]|nr:c-type cytochrome [Pseudomonadota bacterium]